MRAATAHKGLGEHRAVAGFIAPETLGFGKLAVLPPLEPLAAVVDDRLTAAGAAGVGDRGGPAVLGDGHAVDDLRAAGLRTDFRSLAADRVGFQV